MKKRCTNPACRRMFNVVNNGGVCPHCGKAYPHACTDTNEHACTDTSEYDFIQITPKQNTSSMLSHKISAGMVGALFYMLRAVEVWVCADRSLLMALIHSSSALIAVPRKGTLTQQAHQNMHAMQQRAHNSDFCQNAARLMPAQVNVKTILLTLRKAGCNAKRVWSAPSNALWLAYTPDVRLFATSPKVKLGEVRK